MVGEEGGNPPNPPNPPLPWLIISVVVVPRVQHQLPKHLDKLLPKFHSDSKEAAKNHIDNLILVVQTMNVQHEDVVCRLFLLTFEGNESTWYFCLVQGSISNWVEFSQAFLDKFVEDKTPASLALELSRIKIDNKKWIMDFN